MSHTLDPELDFGNPQRIVNDDSLSLNEKLEILQSWKNELMLLQRAEEENMRSASADVGAAATKLADIASAIDRLRRLGKPGEKS